MRSQFSWVTTSIFVFILAGCNRSVVKLDYTNAKNEVPQLGNLVFKFNKPLVNDSLINRWDSSSDRAGEPKSTGRFRWEHSDEWVFSPDKPLLPAACYTRELQDELVSHSKFGKSGNSSPIAFHTPNLQVMTSVGSWTVVDDVTEDELGRALKALGLKK